MDNITNGTIGAKDIKDGVTYEELVAQLQPNQNIMLLTDKGETYSVEGELSMEKLYFFMHSSIVKISEATGTTPRFVVEAFLSGLDELGEE